MNSILNFLYKASAVWRSHVDFYNDKIDQAYVFKYQIFQEAWDTLEKQSLSDILQNDNKLLKEIHKTLIFYKNVSENKPIDVNDLKEAVPSFLALDVPHIVVEDSVMWCWLSHLLSAPAMLMKPEVRQKVSLWYNQQPLSAKNLAFLHKKLPEWSPLVGPLHYPFLVSLMVKTDCDIPLHFIHRYLKDPHFIDFLKTYPLTKKLLNKYQTPEILAVIDKQWECVGRHDWKDKVSDEALYHYWNEYHLWNPQRIDEFLPRLSKESSSHVNQMIIHQPEIRIHLVEALHKKTPLKMACLSMDKKYLCREPDISISIEESSLEFLLHVYLKSRANKAEWCVLSYDFGKKSTARGMQRELSVDDIHAIEDKVIQKLTDELNINLETILTTASLFFPTADYSDGHKRRQAIVNHVLHQSTSYDTPETEILL